MSIKKIIFHPLTVSVFSILGAIFWWSLHRNAEQIRNSTENVALLDQEIAQTASEISQLENNLDEASLLFNQERIARDELLLQKPGEYTVQFPPITSPEPSTTPVASKTPWQAWQEILVR